MRVDGIPALTNPEFIRAQDATYLEDKEPVFGVSIHGDNRAYPLRIMDWHEMANDVVGGVPVALAYCTLCGSGILYDARAKGHTFVFGSSGLLFRSNKLMYDHETNTLWNQLSGEPVIGKLADSGTRLSVLPVVLTSWGQWRSQHPDTKALSLHTRYPRDYTLGATYGSYFASPTTMYPVWRRSGILPAKASVFAVVIGGLPKAYAVAALEKSGGVVNDTIGLTNLVVIHDGAVGNVALPQDWAGEAARRAHHPVPYVNDLTAKMAEEILKKRPELSREVSAKFLLAMPVEERLQLLTDRTDASSKEQPPRPGYFPIALRNEVALQGLIGETRAYDRGAHKFPSAASPRDLRDERVQMWKETEDGLVGPDGERLIRLGGHLSFWFGWYAFHPQTAVFTVPQSMH